MSARGFLSYPVWDRPTRWFHWINFVCVVALAAIGIAILYEKELGVTDSGKILHQLPYWWSHPWAWTKRLMGNYLKFIVVGRLLRFVEDDTFRSRYRQQLSRIIGARGFEPHILFIYAIKVAMHYHFAAIVHALAQAEDANGSMPDAGRSFSRGRKQPKEAQALAS